MRVLREVPLIAAEDTRVTRRLLSAYEIKTPLLSYNEHNQRARTPRLLEALEQGDVALVSDAGTPVLSDPGLDLVQAAAEAGYKVVAVAGPSALAAAVSVAGLPTQEFTFVGFLPRKGKERRQALERLAKEGRAFVLYEAPHRIQATLDDLKDVLGDRRLAACRELTKFYEEVFRGLLSEASSHFTEPRGEFTLVVEGGAPLSADEPVDAGRLSSFMNELRGQGLPPNQSVAVAMAELGVSRREAYSAWVESGKG
ncbi:MAG: 16S rRNA (cytidine1402-2'-O)-methyltransferase [Chloroflexi bacterium]|jgi:16S rRNA (cytidine1402-2'-O)-methyltransferase|nr:MAG: 16S rRNA (cytidine1402-2'-O)-methyltransferase [Chloroflexota bacterium]